MTQKLPLDSSDVQWKALR